MIEGLATIRSSFPAAQTMTRLESAVKEKGFTVFARIDHSAGAAQAGMVLRPTQVLVFGNAKAGTPLMQAAQTLGIDLPLRMLVWEDEQGAVWLSYNEPGWLAKRHALGAHGQQIVDAMAAALAALARSAAEG